MPQRKARFSSLGKEIFWVAWSHFDLERHGGMSFVSSYVLTAKGTAFSVGDGILTLGVEPRAHIGIRRAVAGGATFSIPDNELPRQAFRGQ